MVDQRPCQPDHQIAFVRVSPASPDDLEDDDSVLWNTFRHGDRLLNVWHPCECIPEDGQAISGAIWEYLEIPEEWKLCSLNGELLPPDDILEHHEWLQIRLYSDLEAAQNPSFKYFKVPGEMRSVPINFRWRRSIRRIQNRDLFSPFRVILTMSSGTKLTVEANLVLIP
jgi:hypothetical protein